MKLAPCKYSKHTVTTGPSYTVTNVYHKIPT